MPATLEVILGNDSKGRLEAGSATSDFLLISCMIVAQVKKANVFAEARTVNLLISST